jgi:hypothetical protein
MSHFLLGYSHRHGKEKLPPTQSMFIESSILGIERKQRGLGHKKWVHICRSMGRRSTSYISTRKFKGTIINLKVSQKIAKLSNCYFKKPPCVICEVLLPSTNGKLPPVANLPPVSTTQGELVAKFAAGVVDIGGKFAAGVVDTGGNFPPASLTPVANLPPGVVDTGGAP